MADILEDQRATILQALGECISAWSAVENGLTFLYCEIIRGQSPYWLHATIFDSVISLDTRLDMVEAALRYYAKHLPAEAVPGGPDMPALLGQWKTLRAKIRKRYNKRNEIAHSDVVHSRIKDGVVLTRLEVFPTFSNFGTPGPGKTFLTVCQLKARAGAFRMLVAETGSFATALLPALALLPKFP